MSTTEVIYSSINLGRWPKDIQIKQNPELKHPWTVQISLYYHYIKLISNIKMKSERVYSASSS